MTAAVNNTKRLDPFGSWMAFHEIKSCVILSAGRGTRLHPLTKNVPKPLLPILHRPILFRIIDLLVTLGCIKIGVVVSKETGGEEIQKRLMLEKDFWGDLELIFFWQREPIGTANALQVVDATWNESRFLVVAGDSLPSFDFLKRLLVLARQHEDVNLVLSLEKLPPEQIKSHSLVEIDERIGNDIVSVSSVIEKPKQVIIDGYSSMLLFIASSSIFDLLSVKRSSRDELEITDCLNSMINHHGKAIGLIDRVGSRIHLGTLPDFCKANFRMMGESSFSVHPGAILAPSTIIGKRVILGQNVRTKGRISLEEVIALPGSVLTKTSKRVVYYPSHIDKMTLNIDLSDTAL